MAALPTIKPTKRGAGRWVGGTIAIGLRLAGEAVLDALGRLVRALDGAALSASLAVRAGRQFPDPIPPSRRRGVAGVAGAPSTPSPSTSPSTRKPS